VRERVLALAEVGASPQVPPGAVPAIAALRDLVAERGADFTVADLDPAQAPAPSPFDDPESGLVQWAEENCDGVYTVQFAGEGEEEDEDTLN
jgi:hypothetical protein